MRKELGERWLILLLVTILLITMISNCLIMKVIHFLVIQKMSWFLRDNFLKFTLFVEIGIENQ